jgi:hypothetical protein
MTTPLDTPTEIMLKCIEERHYPLAIFLMNYPEAPMFCKKCRAEVIHLMRIEAGLTE